MKTNQQLKLKTTPRNTLFSCGFFRQCTQSVHSPNTSTSPTLPQGVSLTPPPPPPTALAVKTHLDESSSSSNTSQSFTQWRFPTTLNTPSNSHHQSCAGTPPKEVQIRIAEQCTGNRSLEEVFHVTELQFLSGSDSGRLSAVQFLERCLVPDQRFAAEGSLCPATLIAGVVSCLREGVGAKSASKVLLALCLVEGNRRVAVEAGAVTAIVEALADAETAVAERSLAALELLCTTAEGAAEVRSHALAVPMMVQVMGRMEGRGKEHALSVLGVIYGNCGEEETAVAPAEEVARAVMLALQGDCSARGRRKGAQLLKVLQENGRLDVIDQ